MHSRLARRHNHDATRRKGSASVSLVLAWPIYIAISALVFEIIMLCANYLIVTSAVDRATIHAKQWIAHRDALTQVGSDYEQQIHKEVCESLLPFVITRDRVDQENNADNEIVRELEESGFDSRALPHFKRRWNRISQSTTVRVVPDNPRGPYQDITIDVVYESPFWIPFIGRVMGQPSETGADYYVWQIRQSNRLTVLADQWNRTSLGIEYDPFQSIKQ